TFSQVNSITASLETSFGLEPPLVSVITAISIAFVVFGGIEKISDVSTKIVPFMAILYILASITVLAVHWDQLLPTLALVFKSAFTPAAAVGGFAGATVQQAIQRGIARGVFSNESGLGSAPIAAAAAKSDNPVEQGLISMTGTFIDTLIICTLTGFTILVTDQWSVEGLAGAPLTQAAFATVFGNTGSIALTISLVLFAFTTILGWSYYGERCIEFLFGTKSILPYRLLFVAMVALGGFLKLDLIWTIADIVNGLMALPNLIALLALSPVIIKETRQYFAKRK
ncbi:TPA: alanine/glycine:cation symporter family protein, partial [Streptococcus suis]